MNTPREPARPIEDTLHAAARIEWPGPSHNPKIEALLAGGAPPVRARRHGRLALWIGMGTLMAAGVGYAGTRIYEHYTVRLSVNGATTEHDVEIGENGTGTLVVPLDGGGQATILVGPENAGPDGQIEVRIEVRDTGEESGMETEIVGTVEGDGN